MNTDMQTCGHALSVSDPRLTRHTGTILVMPSPTKTVTVSSMKGGVGKTTATVSLAGAFASLLDLRVLVVDLEPQRNTAEWLLPDGDPYASGCAEILENTHRLEELIQPTSIENLHVIPPGQLDAVGERMVSWRASELAVRRSIIEPVATSQAYDLILIDSPPGIGQLSAAAIAATNAGGGVVTVVRATDVSSPSGARDALDLQAELADTIGAGPVLGYVLTDIARRPSASQRSVAAMADTLLETPRLGEWVHSEVFSAAAALGTPATNVPAASRLTAAQRKQKVTSLTQQIQATAETILEALDAH